MPDIVFTSFSLFPILPSVRYLVLTRSIVCTSVLLFSVCFRWLVPAGRREFLTTHRSSFWTMPAALVLLGLSVLLDWPRLKSRAR